MNVVGATAQQDLEIAFAGVQEIKHLHL